MPASLSTGRPCRNWPLPAPPHLPASPRPPRPTPRLPRTLNRNSRWSLVVNRSRTTRPTTNDQRPTTMPLPDQQSVQTQVAAFEADLAAAKSDRDAQTVRDKYLGRKNSVVASWMQLIAGAAPEEKRTIGRYANELKQAIEARWAAYAEQARSQARPAGAVDVTLPGRAASLGHRHPLTI